MPCRALQLAPTSSLCTVVLLSAPMASLTASPTMAPSWLLTSRDPLLERCACVFRAVCCNHTVRQHWCSWHFAGCQAVRADRWGKVCRLKPYYMAALDGSTPLFVIAAIIEGSTPLFLIAAIIFDRWHRACNCCLPGCFEGLKTPVNVLDTDTCCLHSPTLLPCRPLMTCIRPLQRTPLALWAFSV